MKGHSVLTAAMLMLAAGTVQAHGEASKSHASASDPEEMVMPYGRTGSPGKATRTVDIDMKDTMRFLPDNLIVKRGETVRLRVKNSGQLLHELVLGRAEDLEEHAALMRKFPEMEHDEPNMVHVQPGKTGDIVWTFDTSGEFRFACLIPGHFEAGMTGKVTVK